MKIHFKLGAIALLVSSVCNSSELNFIEFTAPITVEDATAANHYINQTFSREHLLAYERHGVFGHYYSFYPLVDNLPVFSVVDSLAVSRAGIPFRYYQAESRSLLPLQWPESAVEPNASIIAKIIDLERANFEINTIAKGWWKSKEYPLQAVWQIKITQIEPKATLSFYIDVSLEKFLGKERTVSTYQHQYTPGALLSGHSLNALVFDPDPKTKLMDESLEQQDLTKSLPDAAYTQVELRDLQAVENGFVLKGPFVRVVDFNEPVNPSPILTGDLTWRRHDDEFVQVMAYYHLDKAQRHLQDLGYKDQSQILYSPIEIDARGGTNDQSAFSIFENRILLGTGGVPDGEDADVIWHEFGHGLMHFINNTNKGGDSGAIGEGFSDFYAGVHSFRDPQGQIFEPNTMFNWDARFANRKPRTLDDKAAKYNPNYHYPAHQWVKGTLGDQLWSTPLFQGMRRAFEKHGDETINHFERLVIESMFGMGAGLRMDQLALSTLDMAARMYPNMDYAALLQQEFHKHGLILDPIALSFSNEVKQQTGTVPLNFSLQNLAVAKLKNVIFSFGELPDGVVISGEMQPISELLAGETQPIDSQFKLTLGNNISCGQKLTLPVDVDYISEIAAINHSQLALELTIGEGENLSVSSAGGTLIDAIAGDNGLTKDMGVNNFYLDFNHPDQNVIPALKLSLELDHPQLDQLSIKLISPSGLQVKIWDREYYPRKTFNYTLPNSVVDIDWSSITGSSLTGQWQLQIIDHDAGKEGTLLSWGLSQITQYQCQQPTITPTPENKPDVKSKNTGGSLAWSLLILCFAHIARNYLKMEK